MTQNENYNSQPANMYQRVILWTGEDTYGKFIKDQLGWGVVNLRLYLVALSISATIPPALITGTKWAQKLLGRPIRFDSLGHDGARVLEPGHNLRACAWLSFSSTRTNGLN